MEQLIQMISFPEGFSIRRDEDELIFLKRSEGWTAKHVEEILDRLICLLDEELPARALEEELNRAREGELRDEIEELEAEVKRLRAEIEKLEALVGHLEAEIERLKHVEEEPAQVEPPNAPTR